MLLTRSPLERLSIVAQFAIVIFSAAALTLTADAYNFRSPANALWLVVLPVLIGVVCNGGWVPRAAMAAALLALSVVTSILIGVNFTRYG